MIEYELVLKMTFDNVHELEAVRDRLRSREILTLEKRKILAERVDRIIKNIHANNKDDSK